MGEQLFAHFSFSRDRRPKRPDDALDKLQLRLANVQRFFRDRPRLQPEITQRLPRDAVALAEQADQHVFAADERLLQIARDLAGHLNGAFGARRLWKLDIRHRGRPAQHELFDLLPDLLARDVERFQNARGCAGLIVQQREKNVLGANVMMVEAARFLLRARHHRSRLGR